MRTCPVCESSERRVVVPEYMNFELYACCCGMHYVDSQDVSQRWFDGYYLSVYQTDDLPYSDKRLDSLAKCVMSYEPRHVLDIGGMDGELQKRITAPCDVSGVLDGNDRKYDAVVLSHTLEHIYDMPAMMQRIKCNLGNRLFIEVPVWTDYGDMTYDRHWQHVNKFTVSNLEAMLIHYGFNIAQSVALPDYREYRTHRVIAWLR